MGKLAVEKVFPTPRGYKGVIRYALIMTCSGQWKIEKRRPFGWKAHRITENEANLCDSRKKAESLWYYRDMIGTASWWGEEIIHPFYGFEYTREHIKRLRDELGIQKHKVNRCELVAVPVADGGE